jgi:hypothetical protein
MKKRTMVFLALLLILFAVPVTQAGPMAGGVVSFQWDISQESDLDKYKLYWGTKSRLTEEAKAGAAEKIAGFCGGSEKPQGVYVRGGVSKEECIKSWADYCDQGRIAGTDPACDYDLFSYENSIDIAKENGQQTLKGLPDGTLYFTLVAVDKDANESAYSVEARHTIDATAPNIVVGVSSRLNDKSEWKVTVELIQEQP